MRQIQSILALWIITTVSTLTANAQDGGRNPIDELQAQMYRLFYTEDSLRFYEVVDQLKDECKMAENEQVFYKAWGNHAIYESTHQRRNHALEIAREMKAYADEEKSTFGTYTAIHVMGSIYQQMRDYDNAQRAFLEAIDFLHRNAPGESAAADYIELMIVSVNGQNNVEQALAYANEALKEPNVTDHHKLRVLSMLCQLEGERPEPDVEVFNRYYQQRQEVLAHTSPDSPDNNINVIWHMLNGNYDRALELTSLLRPEQKSFEQARIFHRMGQDADAYRVS